MYLKIIKRNGKVVNFNPNKIEIAVKKALIESKESGKAEINSLLTDIYSQIKDKMTVEEIQDIIFAVLCKNNLTITAREFERYRTRRTVERENQIEKVYNDIGAIIKNGSDENSNKDSVLMGVKRDLMAGEYFRHTLSQDIPKSVFDAHKKKLIHWHDSDYDRRYGNCSIPHIPDMLKNGTKIVNAWIGEPNSVQVASNVIMQIVFSVSNSQYGNLLCHSKTLFS